MALLFDMQPVPSLEDFALSSQAEKRRRYKMPIYNAKETSGREIALVKCVRFFSSSQNMLEESSLPT